MSQLLLAFLFGEQMKYSIGQYIYSAKKISGWWDYSLINRIPENSHGIIEGIAKWTDINNEIMYIVNFTKFPELGSVFVRESSLKLG